MALYLRGRVTCGPSKHGTLGGPCRVFCPCFFCLSLSLWSPVRTGLEYLAWFSSCAVHPFIGFPKERVAICGQSCQGRPKAAPGLTTHRSSKSVYQFLYRVSRASSSAQLPPQPLHSHPSGSSRWLGTRIKRQMYFFPRSAVQSCLMLCPFPGLDQGPPWPLSHRL